MKTATHPTTRVIGLALTTALATTMLSGCAGKAAPSSAMSAASAKAAIARGKGDKAVSFAEAAVLAAPRDAQTRALLAAAYVEAGRFASATTAFGDAVALGDDSSRTVLSYALSLAAVSRYADAQKVLAAHQSDLDPADYGLAITLAGSPQQGIEVLSNALRYGKNTPKLRQNLAYSFALSGDWRSARLLASQDVAADKIDQRLGEWAQMSLPQMATQRVAALLGVTVDVADSGQPVMLALKNFPTNEQLAQAAMEPAAEPDAAPALASVELPAAAETSSPAAATALAQYEPAAAPVAVSRTPAAPRIVLPAPVAAKAPVRVAAVAKPRTAAKRASAPKPAFVRQPGAYRVQLGSYLSMSDASAAWLRFQKRHPGLKGSERVITKAQVNGRTYYRVAAGGFARSSASSFCTLVKESGGGCLAYSGTLPGAVAQPAVRTAAKSNATRVAAR